MVNGLDPKGVYAIIAFKGAAPAFAGDFDGFWGGLLPNAFGVGVPVFKLVAGGVAGWFVPGNGGFGIVSEALVSHAGYGKGRCCRGGGVYGKAVGLSAPGLVAGVVYGGHAVPVGAVG